MMQELAIHHLHVLDTRGAERIARNVHCPARDQWVTLATCEACARCAHLSASRSDGAWLLLCTDATSGAEEGLEEAMVSSVLCARTSVPAALLARALDTHRARAAIIADEDGHAVGVLSRT